MANDPDSDTFRVQVVPYDSGWPRRFERERELILGALSAGPDFSLHHIGSTAVPGLVAKPIIDLLMEVAGITALDRHEGAMRRIGYQPMGEFGLAGRRYFRKGGARRTHHLHAFERGSHACARHLAFRDFLRAHPSVAADYGALKRRLAAACAGDIEAYMDGKDAFVRHHERLAVAWWDGRAAR